MKKQLLIITSLIFLIPIFALALTMTDRDKLMIQVGALQQQKVDHQKEIKTIDAKIKEIAAKIDKLSEKPDEKNSTNTQSNPAAGR